MKILLTNDDGYDAKGIKTLARIMRKYGELLIVAPKGVQSGMSMAVSMGFKPISVRKIEESGNEQWWSLDGTPASCVKYGIDNILYPAVPDLVVSGINHGSNAATAAHYSGTVGAAMEGAVNRIPSIAVSLDSFDADADFSAVEEILPGILDKLLPRINRNYGVFYNINFPNLPADRIRGVKVTSLGAVHWENEYRDFHGFLELRGRVPTAEDIEYIRRMGEDELLYVMAGDLTDNPGNRSDADHLLLDAGYVTVTPQTLDNTDYDEMERLCAII